MRFLLVDDDAEIRSSLRVAFELGWRDVRVVEAASGEEALDLVEIHRPDLVLLDVGLPDMDGYAVLRELRRFTAVPVIMLTARDQAIDKVRGLEAGADDYVGKPFDHLELMARVRAVLRRLDRKAPGDRVAAYRRGDVEIDLGGHALRVSGQPVPLTATEWRLLEVLVGDAGWIVPHERIAARIWGRDESADHAALRVFVRRLRAKLNDDAQTPRYIETVRGLGYRLLPSESRPPVRTRP
jgi:DNA-binding response OmpR family regulator